MFDPYPATFRIDRQPTKQEVWARQEARSRTMAAELLKRSAPAAGHPSKRPGRRPLHYSAIFACGAAAIFLLFWLR